MWDKRYDTDEYIYGKRENDFLAFCVSQLPKGEILSLCEGEGRNAVYLARKGYNVTAVDGSQVGLEKAQRLASERGVKIQTIVANLNNYKIEPGKWQGIISFFCHLPSSLRKKVHRECVNGLVPGGVLVLESFTPAQLKFGTGGPSDLQRLLGLEEAKEELDGLEFLIAQEIERPIDEGELHRGMAAVLQILAVKE